MVEWNLMSRFGFYEYMVEHGILVNLAVQREIVRMQIYDYAWLLMDYIYYPYRHDKDVKTRMKHILLNQDDEYPLTMHQYLETIEEETRQKVFEEQCREQGGEPEPIPCDWFNSYCEEEPECVYRNQPIMEDEEIGMYCCIHK